ncbi:MAG TPA: hypothetical protein VH540_18015 [Ktedonobacterales bacterium]
MVTDPTRHLMNRLIMLTMMQGVVIGIELTLSVGMIWANHTEATASVASLAQFLPTVNPLLLGIVFLMNAKVVALRQQLHPRPSVEGLPLLFIIVGLFMLSISSFMLIILVFLR